MPSALGLPDVLVLTASLAAVVAIALRARGARTLEAYALADRELPWWAILGSIVATETSAATLLGVIGAGYSPSGFRVLQLALGYILGRVVVARVLLPLYVDGRLFTAYEMLGRYFGAGATRASAAAFLVARTIGDGLRLFLAGLVIQQLTGWTFAANVSAIVLVTLGYTAVGGMRAVVWANCLQLAVYMAGAIAALAVLGMRVPGGWAAIWDHAATTGALTFVDVTPSWTEPYTLWAGVIGGAAIALATHGADQVIVQRYLAARDRRAAARALVASGVVTCVQMAVLLAVGVGLAAYYSSRPQVTFIRTDTVFVHFIVNAAAGTSGVTGLLIAGIFAAAMAALSSSVNASAATLIHDIWLPLRRRPITPFGEVKMTRAATLAFGGLQVVVAFWATRLSSEVIDDVLTATALAASVLIGVYALGRFAGRARGRAAWTGAAAGAGAMLFLQWGLPAAGWPRAAFPWVAVAGSMTTWGIGLAVSRISRPVSRDVGAA